MKQSRTQTAVPEVVRTATPPPSSRGHTQGNGHRGVLADYVNNDTLFEAGVRTLRDLVAPTSVSLATRDDYLYIEQEGRGRYIRYFTVIGFPRHLNAGWIDQLNRLSLPMQMVFHIEPFEPSIIIRQLEMHLTKIESQRMSNRMALRLEKADQAIGADDVRRIMNGVAAGIIRIFSVSLTIGIHAGSLSRLDQRSNYLLTHLRQLQLRAQTARLLQDTAWQSCLPTGRDSIYRRTNLDNGSLAMCFPFTSATIGTPDGAFLGEGSNREPVFFNPWSRQKRLANANIIVCGESGQGKSYFIKKLMTGMMATGEVDAVVIDRDDDYAPLCDFLGGEESQHINLARGCPINPFDLPFLPADAQAMEDHGDLLAEHIDNNVITFLSMLLADSLLSKEEEAILFQAMVQTYASAGITRDAIRRDPNTLLLSAPLYGHLARTLDKMTNIRPEQKVSLIDRLEKPAYLFKGETSISIRQPLTVFSIRELDEKLYPLMIYTVRNFVARNRAELRYERFLMYLIEEASFMLRHPAGRKFLEQSSRGVRKLGISQITISQHPDDFLEDGKVIVSNAGSAFFLGMKMSAIEKLKLTPRLERTLAQAKPGDLVMRLGNEYSYFQVKASPLEHKIFTTDPFELREARAGRRHSA